jgi:ADP-ribosyl-[dinitrogen reductase] hydrolase
MKTSQTHPLKIDSVRAGRGRIGLTFCPGKKQPDSYSGPWDRDLRTDLQTIKTWGASALVTLIEDHEFDELHVSDLGTQAEAAGLEWHHLPITDVNVPDATFEQSWTYSGHRLRSILLAGKGIVVHCKGGLGRTGTIAGRLMIELGEDAEEAIRDIRHARPGSIETFGHKNSQEDYVRRCKSVSGDIKFTDRVLGCLIGGAVGDAFGYEVEFKSLRLVHDSFGDDGIAEPVFHGDKLIVSDDTQMTMFTLEGLLRADINDVDEVNEQIRLAYTDWLSTQTEMDGKWVPTGDLCSEAVLKYCRAPGNTCVSALQYGGWGTIDTRINDSKGCGGVMRVAPLGLVHPWTPEQVFNAAARAAAITHGHPSGFWSADAMAAMIKMLVEEEELEAATLQVIEMLGTRTEHEETSGALKAALFAFRSGTGIHTDQIKQLGEGWVGEEALAIGLYAALVGQSFPEVLAIASNHDGDSDSTASIAGQLYGAWRGLADLPHSWVRRLDVSAQLTSACCRLITASFKIRT